MIEKPKRFTKKMFIKAIFQSFIKLNPFFLIHNPVMLITEIGAVLTTVELFITTPDLFNFILNIVIWLWFTVLFANFSESIAQLHSQAQADFLKKSRKEVIANKLVNGKLISIQSTQLKKDDIVVVNQNELIPSDGEIIEGIAQIDESAITGESNPIIRGAGTDNSSVTAGTKVLSNKLKIKISANPGESYLDQMINLIEKAARKKTHNEMALTLLLSGLTFIFFIGMISLKIISVHFGMNLSITILIAFLICLIPTTIAGLLNAVGIAGINHLVKKNVLATNRQSIEAAGDIDIIMLDKTGTITVGNRQVASFIPDGDTKMEDFVKAVYLSSYLDTTTEGRNILSFIEKNYPEIYKLKFEGCKWQSFSADTLISGCDFKDTFYRKGSRDSIEKFTNRKLSHYLVEMIEKISKQGSTPLVVTDSKKMFGIIELKDKIKPAIKEYLQKFHKLGQKTIMITGDNEITAKAIADEININEYVAKAKPKDKLDLILAKQKDGYLIAMTGDGVNDAPALAQADLGVAMNSGTEAAKEAANMIDLDSTPIKLFDIIQVGKEMLMTRGALTTFSIANDISKYLVIIPAILIPYFPFFESLNIMHLSSPQNAILAAVIYNAISIIMLVPLAFKGVSLKLRKIVYLLQRNILIYGLGGVVIPFIGIKLIDLLIFYLAGK